MTYPKDLVRLERTYIKEAKKELSESRRRLLEALLGLGLGTAFLTTIRREMDLLSTRMADIGRGHAAPMQEVAARKAQADLTDLHLSFDAARLATEAGRGEAVKQLESAAWVAALSARLSAEAQNLRAGGEPVDVAAQQLFALENADRASVWRNGQNNMQLESQRNLWTVGVGLVAAYYVAAEMQAGRPLYKMAVAQLDDKTTDCCIEVNGQVQRLDDPFELTGTPRFSDSQMHPPFHWNCRTVEDLVSKI